MRNLVFLVFLFSACTSTKTVVTGVVEQHAMVVTAHPEATKAGLKVLKRGGNAFDAAVAVKFALSVVYPRAGNIGGGGFAVYRMNDGTSGTLDFREKAPLAAHKDMYLDESGDVIKHLSVHGHLSVGVPGTVDGMVRLHNRFGKLPWKDLLQPAIELAAEGYLLTEQEAAKLNDYQERFYKYNTHPILFLSDAGWKKGDTIINSDLAATLRRIAGEGRNGFYGGKTAELILREMKKGQGIITQADLDMYEAKWRDPISINYKGHRLITMPPPSSGGIALAQLLEGFEQFSGKIKKHNSARNIHIMAELERRVYADRATYLADTDFFKVPEEMLTSEEYLRKRNASISLKHATPSEEIKQGKVDFIESVETTHFSIVDEDGNAVAITTTLNDNFGSKVMVEGGGFFLNDEMDDFSAKPGVPNIYGLVGNEANSIQPGKRMLSSMTPTIAEKNGKLYMVVGTPGGSTIITSVFQAIVNVIDFDMTMQEAINHKRVHHQWLPDRILHEPGAFNEKTAARLKKYGHKLEIRSEIGRLNCIKVLENGSLEGAADIRGENVASGY